MSTFPLSMAGMGIAEDIQKLEPGALVELFVLDATSLPGGGVSYFHASTNALGGPVVWQGAEYQPWPVQVRGFEKSGTGRLPRPSLSMANVLGTVGTLARDFNDLLGARLIRKRTFARYLDAVNFPGGVNPTASSVESFPDDEFVVDQKTVENKHLIEFSLMARCDLEGVRIPLRVITQTCGWQYRGEGCSPGAADESTGAGGSAGPAGVKKEGRVELTRPKPSWHRRGPQWGRGQRAGGGQARAAAEAGPGARPPSAEVARTGPGSWPPWQEPLGAADGPALPEVRAHQAGRGHGPPRARAQAALDSPSQGRAPACSPQSGLYSSYALDGRSSVIHGGGEHRLDATRTLDVDRSARSFPNTRRLSC